MNHPLQEEDASLFASPFSPMEQQLINNAAYARGGAGDMTQVNDTEGQHIQHVHEMTSNNQIMSQQQQPQQYNRTLQHANSMPYPVQNTTTKMEGTVYNNTANSAAAATPIIGPRGKCDQVIYEAMTKACEIVVRGRCTQLDLTERRIIFQQQQQVQQGGVNARGYSDGTIPSSMANATSNNSSSSSSSRFNIQVEEVPSVRSILQTWKRALTIPLRLDIFYEYDGGGGGVQRELLERWCIDYKNANVPTSSLASSSSSSSKVMTGATTTKSSSSSSSMNNNNNNMNSSVSQLRLVCKRIVVLLRNLHCMTRMLPAYRLQSLIDNNSINYGDGILGMIPDNNNNNGSGMGIIGYSIYASDYEPNGPTLPSPSFTQQSFPSVKTPFGTLGVSVMYDATLNPHQMVEGLLVDRLRSEEDVWARQQQQQQQWQEGIGREGQQQFNTAGFHDDTALRSSNPIPVPQETIPTPGQSQLHNNSAVSQSQQGGIGDGKREFGSCPPTLLRGRSRSSSLGGLSATGGGRTRAVSDLIITDYHSSPAIRPKASPGIGSSVGNEKRIMSGLSLAMMADENSQQQQQLQQYPTTTGGMPLTPDEYLEQDDSAMQHTWGSLATRAAFHHPPPTYESPGITDDTDPAVGATNNIFKYHGGYGYGYNGSQVQLNSEELQTPFPPVGSAGSRATSDGLSISPSPLMSTPPPHYSSYMKRRQTAAGTANPSSLKENLGDTQNSDQVDDDENAEAAPPFTNPTTLQALPASGTLSAVPTSPSTHASRQLEQASSSVGNSPQHPELRNDSQRRQSSSSVLLPPVTSLDLLQKSPFTATKGGNDGTGRDADSLAMPFTLGSYRDEMFMSSIPKLVAAGSKSRTSSLAGSNSGTNPFMASFGQSSAGGYYSTGPFASRREIHGCSQSDAVDEAEEMPFALALDEDSPFAKSSSRSLLGSTRGDHSGLASSSLAVSSLHQRCDQGKPRLKMFSRSRTQSSGGISNEEVNSDKDSTAADYSSIKDQLSEFRTWHSSSLMVNSASK